MHVLNFHVFNFQPTVQVVQKEKASSDQSTLLSVCEYVNTFSPYETYFA